MERIYSKKLGSGHQSVLKLSSAKQLLEIESFIIVFVPYHTEHFLTLVRTIFEFKYNGNRRANRVDHKQEFGDSDWPSCRKSWTKPDRTFVFGATKVEAASESGK